MPKMQGQPGVLGRVTGVLGRSRELTLVALIILMCAIVSLGAPQFLSISNLDQVTAMAAIFAIAGIGEAMVVMTKNIDLSVESTIGLVAFLVGVTLRQGDLPVPAAWLLGIGVGLLLGMVNGAVITLFRIPSIVVTLGTLSIFRGLVFIIAGGKEVNLSDLPAGYANLATDTVLGVPVFVIVAVVIVAVVGLMLWKTRFGRQVYAVGSNAEAAAILGIRSRLVTFAVFSIAGLLGGIAGVMWGIYFGTIYATSASGVVLQIVAAVVVGGVSIAGGTGTVVGAALGALFLALINNALLVLQLPQELLQAIYGAVILVAVSADALLSRRNKGQAAQEAAR
ncbi:MAG: ABC transporter permease [Candidatus Limnocylindrales bacterium]